MNKLLKKALPIMLSTTLIVPLALSKVNVTASAATTSTSSEKRIVSYFPNWACYDERMGKHEVQDIPWDEATVINHGFWEIGANYKAQTTDSWADFEMEFDHSEKEDWDKYPNTGSAPGQTLLKGHFGEYKYYKQQNPNVKILISVGGWTRSEKFHDLAKSDANIETFAQSLVDTMEKYPFIDGFDLDWEYPGITRSPETFPGSTDRGAVGGPEDKENFTKLLKSIREKFDSTGFKDKMLTVAFSAGREKIENSEPDKYCQYVDYIGVMTYDLAGSWDDTTGHLAGLYSNPADPLDGRKECSVDDAMKIYSEEYGVPKDKLLVGSPLYSRGWSDVEAGPNGDGLFQKGGANLKGTPAEGGSSEGGGQYEWWGIKQSLEAANSGWTKYRDPVARTPYLYNASKKAFISYEDEESLQARCNYVNKNNYGGLIVWDTSGDDSNHTMHKIMKEGLRDGKIFPVIDTPQIEYPEGDVNKDLKVDLKDLALVAEKYNAIKGDKLYDENCDVVKDGQIELSDLVKVGSLVKDDSTTGGSTENPDTPENPDTSKDTWDSTKSYAGGSVVIYKGVKYTNKWWAEPTDVPGKAEVWVVVNE